MDRKTLKDFELQIKNTRRLIDRFNVAYYGMTWEEHERLHGKEKEGRDDEHEKAGAEKGRP